VKEQQGADDGMACLLLALGCDDEAKGLRASIPSPRGVPFSFGESGMWGGALAGGSESWGGCGRTYLWAGAAY
jgi:hypothetical protein